MQVILLDKVVNLGKLGDKVNVKAGYARNFLVPTGKAVPATKKNIEFFEARRAELEAASTEELNVAQQRAVQITDLEKITIAGKAGDEGRLFGSIGARDIAEALTNVGIKVTKTEVRLSNGSLRTLGEHNVELHFHTDVTVALVVDVVAEV